MARNVADDLWEMLVSAGVRRCYRIVGDALNPIMGLTYDVLTRGFYDQLGYQTVGIIEDCPAGTTTRWYCKEL